VCLRRGMGVIRFSVPPSAASRAALSRATSASSPILTKAVFSFTPVSLQAFANKASSILSVVLMHTSMHESGIIVKTEETCVQGQRI